MKILIIQQKMIGDVLTTSILFEALKEEHREAELHYVVNANTLPVVENNPFIDQFLVVTAEMQSSKYKFLDFLKSIKLEKYDAVIDVYSKISSNLITKFSKADIKISKHKWHTAHYYTHTFKESETPKTNAGLAIENRIQLLKPLCKNVPKPIRPKIYLTSEEKSKAQQFLTKNGIDLSKSLFMISVLGSGETKTYPPKYMAELLDCIAVETKGQILFNYIPNQLAEAEAVYKLCKTETKKQIFFNVFGKNLRDFLAITSSCNALIGNEGGAVNMAKALQLPTFTIFSPWIKKEAWVMFDDDVKNVSVHLKDFRPDLYQDKTMKVMKKNVDSLYNQFQPQLIVPKLKDFLNQF